MYQNRTTYPKKKNNMYKSLSIYANQYKNIALIRMEKVRASQISTLRKKLNDTKIFGIKDRIAKKALINTNVQRITNIINGINGQCMLVFTNMSPFKLSLILAKNKTMLLAREGDVSNIDVVISAKNTGIAPGPILTDFKENGIPTKIDQGTIWITKETTIIKKGEKISSKLASILGKLSIKPIEATVRLNGAIEDSKYYNNDELTLDTNTYIFKIIESYKNNILLSTKCNYIMQENISMIFTNLVNQAYNISMNIAYVTDDNKKHVVSNAYNYALVLSSKIKDAI
ncbi:MAG: 50S ribosomal protein L10 [Thaumarchaeota archaeon]|nr:50S ribosomal protein L10 [Nitrososphaerota archaeon]